MANKTLFKFFLLKKSKNTVCRKLSSLTYKTSLVSLVMLQRCYPVKQFAVGGPDAWLQANREPNPQT